MPGDAGLPPEFTFTLSPSELKASAPLFPLPERTVTSGLITFGYGGETLFPFNVELPRGASGRAQIALHVEYLACKDMCVPESADVKFSIQLTSKEKIQMTQRPLLLLYAPSLNVFKTTAASRRPLTAIEFALMLRGTRLSAGRLIFFRPKKCNRSASGPANRCWHHARQRTAFCLTLACRN